MALRPLTNTNEARVGSGNRPSIHENVMKRLLITLPMLLAFAACKYGHRDPQQAEQCRVPSGQVTAKGDEIELTGSLTAPMLECVERMHPQRFSRVDVNLSGGEPGPSLGLAQELASTRPIIHIERYCGSSCAYLLLPTASKIEAEPNSIVLFHNTTTSSSILLSRGDSPERDKYAALSRAELALYDKLHIGAWLLTGPFNHQEPTCFSQDPPPGIYKAKWKAMFIDRSLLQRIGLNLPQTVASTPIEMQRALEDLPDHGASVAKGGLGYISADAIKNAETAIAPKIPSMPRC